MLLNQKTKNAKLKWIICLFFTISCLHEIQKMMNRKIDKCYNQHANAKTKVNKLLDDLSKVGMAELCITKRT